MPFPAWVIPAIISGLGAAGNYLGGRAQSKALGEAGQISQQATNDAMSRIMALYDQGRQDLAPYRSVGQPALNRLQSLAGHPQSSIGATQAPARNALAEGGGGSFVPQASNAISTATGKVGSRNALLGGGLGFLAGGPVGGLIGSQFGKNNPDKAASSRGVDELSRQVWGTNTPGIPAEQLTSGLVADVVQRRKSVAQGKQEFEQLWSSWIKSMQDAGVNPEIIRSSIATQRQYFQPVKDVFARLEGQQGVA